MLKIFSEGRVALYHSNQGEKLRTNQDGVTIGGNTDINGNLDLTGAASTQGRISANYLDVPNISPVGSIMIWPGGTNYQRQIGDNVMVLHYLRQLIQNCLPLLDTLMVVLVITLNFPI